MQPQPSTSKHINDKAEAFASPCTGLATICFCCSLVVVVMLFHILTNGQYGFHRDELDILMNARQLDWGYVAYPPLTPFRRAHRSDTVWFFIDWAAPVLGYWRRALWSFSWVLWPAILAAAVWLRWSRRWRCYCTSRPDRGMLIQYLSFDYLWWVLLSFCTVRLLRTDDPRWWLGIGTAIGLGMMTKYTMIFFVAGLVVGILFTSCGAICVHPGCGLVRALLCSSSCPIWSGKSSINLSLWTFLSAIHARDIEWGRTDSFLTDQLYVTANPFTLPLWVAGLLFCIFGSRWKTIPTAGLDVFDRRLCCCWSARGRSYYVGPAYPMLLAAGAAWVESWLHTLSPGGARWGRVGLAVDAAVGRNCGCAAHQTGGTHQLAALGCDG